MPDPTTTWDEVKSVHLTLQVAAQPVGVDLNIKAPSSLSLLELSTIVTTASNNLYYNINLNIHFNAGQRGKTMRA